MYVEYDKQKYSSEFQSFIENIYRHDGVEGIANCLPFIEEAFAVTVDGKFAAANDRFLSLVGYDRGELYGKDIDLVIYSDDVNKVRNRLDEGSLDSYQIRLRTRGGDIRHVIISPNLITIDGVDYRLAQFIDYTRLVTLQKNKLTALRKTAAAISNMIESRDPYTYGHMHRTAEIAVEIARKMTLKDEALDAIYLAASIHDIGKISIPLEILIKPGKLEAFEWEHIRVHPVTGHRILKDIEFDKVIKQIVLMHHEYQDGSGYPDGKSGEDIPIEVAIVTAADCLEAIAGIRPYHQANTFETALEIMKRESAKFHKDVLSIVDSLITTGELTGREYGLQS